MYAPGSNKDQKAILSFKVKVKVIRSLTLMSFERVSLVEYECQIWSQYLLRFKSYSEGKSWQQIDKQTDRQTGQKQYAPDHSIRGHKCLGRICTMTQIRWFDSVFIKQLNPNSRGATLQCEIDVSKNEHFCWNIISPCKTVLTVVTKYLHHQLYYGTIMLIKSRIRVILIMDCKSQIL